MARRPRVVVVGGGFGGLAAARALGRAPVEVIVVDRRNYHLFQPLLYQVATAVLSPGDIASPIRWILRRQANARVLLGEVTAIDPDRREVVLRDRRLAYDYLILAAGAAYSYFGHDEWSDRAPGLKTLEDALDIRHRVLVAFERAEHEPDPAVVRRLLTFAVVGGGATGVELAGALAELARHTLRTDFRRIDPGAARIVLLEAGPDVLPAFPPRLRASARRALARLGVEVRTGAAVKAVTDDGVMVDGERLEAATVLWAAGVTASPLGRSLGAPLDRAGRVVVRADLTVPGRPEIFVVGDLAAFTQDGRPLPGVAPVAIQQARHAARNVRRALEGRPYEPFRYHDPGMLATVGRSAAVADFGWLRLTGRVAWLTWLFVHILKLTGFRNRLLVLLQWAWAYVTYQRSIRLITHVDRARTAP
jgi:NADH dehydrogenase